MTFAGEKIGVVANTIVGKKTINQFATVLKDLRLIRTTQESVCVSFDHFFLSTINKKIKSLSFLLKTTIFIAVRTAITQPSTNLITYVIIVIAAIAAVLMLIFIIVRIKAYNSNKKGMYRMNEPGEKKLVEEPESSQ